MTTATASQIVSETGWADLYHDFATVQSELEAARAAGSQTTGLERRVVELEDEMAACEARNPVLATAVGVWLRALAD